MKLSEESLTLNTPNERADRVWTEVSGKMSHAGALIDERPDQKDVSTVSLNPSARDEAQSVVLTFLTTLATFFIFLIQGILLARILGPEGRGEFGTAIFFPRDALLYAGLLGGIEVVSASASRIVGQSFRLKYSAARLGLFSGTLTGLAGALLAVGTILFTDVMYGHDKWYLLPYCLFCCLFVPIEHVHLNVSAVDRGKADYGIYNFNRLLYALAFPVALLTVYLTGLHRWLPFSDLTIVCGLFLGSRFIGILPTLRGMDLRQVFRGKRARGLSEDAQSDSVPSAWRLLCDGRGYALSMFATELFERLDVLLIVVLAPVVESGYYFVAVPVAAILTVAPNALGVFTFNAGADPNRYVSVRQAVSVMVATAGFQVVAALVYSMVMPFLLVTIFKPDFANSIPYALWLLPACAMKGFLQAVDGYLKGRGKPMLGVWSRVISIIVMLLFVWVSFRFSVLSDDRRWLCIPMAACAGQAVSMLIISIAVLRDVSSATTSDAFRFSESDSKTGGV
jgi:hypothetical protein